MITNKAKLQQHVSELTQALLPEPRLAEFETWNHYMDAWMHWLERRNDFRDSLLELIGKFTGETEEVM